MLRPVKGYVRPALVPHESEMVPQARRSMIMRKLSFTSLLLLVVSLLFVPAASAHTGGKAIATQTEEEILIDGDLSDAAWATATPVYIVPSLVPVWQQFNTHLSIGTPPRNDEDISGIFYFLWDTENLYFAGRVNDDVVLGEGDPWQQDGVELFLDVAHQGMAGRQIFINPKGGENGDRFTVSVPEAEVAGQLVDGGYCFEVKFPLGALNIKAAVGKVIGMDIQVDDKDKVGQREKAIVWSGGDNMDWNTPSIFGDLVFGGPFEEM